MQKAELDPRSRAILRQAVGTFIAFGEPVGSRTLSKMSREGLSAATIRNIMADLEEMGFLYQPHTSAGRVPTDKGYRYYVSTLVGGTVLPPSDQALIGESLRRTDGDVELLVQRTLHLLSHMTDTVGFVTGPDFQQNILRHIDFVRLAPRRVLVVLVSRTGQVINRIVEIPEDLSSDELQKCGRYLESEYQGHTLAEARESLLARMQEMRAIYDRLLRNALTLGQAAFAQDVARQDVHLEGASRMLGKPEFRADTDRARQLLATLEEKERLIKILNACLDGRGLQIIIGSESHVPDFEGISLIGTRYRYGDRELGSIGIMGPTRMEYARFISVVDYVARCFSEVISGTGAETTN